MDNHHEAPAPGAATIRPGKHWYAVSLVVLAAGVGVAGWQINSGASGARGEARPVRGRGVVRLDQPGTYSLYVYRGASRRADASANRAWTQAHGARVTVRDEQTGDELVVRSVYETMEMQNNRIARLAEFDISAPGSYVVTIQPGLSTLGPSVRPGGSLDEFRQGMMGAVRSFLIALGVGALAVVVSAAIFLVVLVGRMRSKRRLAAAV